MGALQAILRRKLAHIGCRKLPFDTVQVKYYRNAVGTNCMHLDSCGCGMVKRFEFPNFLVVCAFITGT